ncbi:hypothetical protein LVD15_23760 [Fulvivirga maritima]|uniref:hypothetical protein n=1 Tax=Fulvivirga maritima TaxID=2904247 RepID=UPI001F434A35|nr:hypothetical protein [Fulvivirga maritima]UII26277.1 hypothetical protein LVD15_23760 [Fulvivirga maritima]
MASIWINADRKIVDADESWDVLANKNKADELSGNSIKGKYITSFIKGDQIRMFLDAMITRVNVTEKPYVLHYRCDGPHKAQFMRMMVSKENDDLFHIEHDLIKSEKIRPKLLLKEDANAEQKRCAVCGRVNFKDGWYDALINRKIFGTVHELKTKSSICPDCEDKIPTEN